MKTTKLIESLKKSIFTLETDAARLSDQCANRLASAERMVATLQEAVQTRDREIVRLNGRLTESQAKQTAIHGVETAYNL